MKNYLKDWEMRILFAYPTKNTVSKRYSNLTEQQCKERLEKYRTELEIQIRLAVSGGAISERNPSDQQRQCLHGIIELMRGGLSSYVVLTLKRVVLSVIDYRNAQGETISLAQVNCRLKGTTPDSSQLQAIVDSYMSGFDAESQQYLSRMDGYAAK